MKKRSKNASDFLSRQRRNIIALSIFKAGSLGNPEQTLKSRSMQTLAMHFIGRKGVRTEKGVAEPACRYHSAQRQTAAPG